MLNKIHLGRMIAIGTSNFEQNVPLGEIVTMNLIVGQGVFKVHRGRWYRHVTKK